MSCALADGQAISNSAVIDLTGNEDFVSECLIFPVMKT